MFLNITLTINTKQWTTRTGINAT